MELQGGAKGGLPARSIVAAEAAEKWCRSSGYQAGCFVPARSNQPLRPSMMPIGAQGPGSMRQSPGMVRSFIPLSPSRAFFPVHFGLASSASASASALLLGVPARYVSGCLRRVPSCYSGPWAVFAGSASLADTEYRNKRLSQALIEIIYASIEIKLLVRCK